MKAKLLLWMFVILLFSSSVLAVSSVNQLADWAFDTQGTIQNSSLTPNRQVNQTGTLYFSSPGKIGTGMYNYTGGNGLNNYFSRGTDFINSQSHVSYAGWFKLTAYASDSNYIFSVAPCCTNFYVFRVQANSSIYVGDAVGGAELGSYGSQVSINEWYFFTLTTNRTSGSTQVYLFNTTNTSGIVAINFTGRTGTAYAATFHLGSFGGNQNWNGSIDQFMIWNRSVSFSEAQQMYADYTNPPNFTITAIDEFNSTAIQVFSANVSGTMYHTTNGTITTSLLSNDTSLYNITLNVSNYFHRTYSSYNISSSGNLQGQLHMAELCLNSTQKVSNASLSGVTYYIGSTSSTSCFNVTAATHSVVATKAGWFNQTRSFTLSALEQLNSTVQNMSYANLTIFVRKANGGTYLSSYDLNISSLNHTSWPGENQTGVTNYSWYLINDTYIVTVRKSGYAYTNATANISVAGNTNYTFYLYEDNTVNITFYDEATSAIMSNTTNISVTIIWADTNATVNYTTTSNLYVVGLTAGNYEIRYSATNYTERSHHFTLTDHTYEELNLYMLADATSDDITNTLLDEFGNRLQGYIIVLQRYYPSLNAYVTVDDGTTNDEGQTVLRGILNGPYYKFLIQNSDGTTLKTSSSTQLYDTTVTHYLTLGEEIGTTLDNLNGVEYSLTYISSTKQFKYTWSNPTGTVVSATLYIYNKSAKGDTLYNSSTVATSSGTIYLAVAEINDTTYEAQAYVTFSGNTEATLLDTLTKSFSGVVATFGTFGLFLSFIIIITLALLGIWQPTVAVILVPIGIIMTRISHLHNLSWTWIVSICAVAVIILYVIRDKA